jgi:hypothetical protein
MDDPLIAIFVMRGIERLAVALISGMCLFLGWKLISKILDHPVREDLINADWSVNWKRPFIHVMRVIPSVVLAIAAGFLLYSLMKPIRAHISEVSPAGTSCGQWSKETAPVCLTKTREYLYEDSGF